MDFSSGAAISALASKVPLILKTTALHTAGMTPTASKVDLKTELLVTVVRSFIDGSNPTSISKRQRGSMRDPGIKGRKWISRTVVPQPPEDDVRQAVFGAIDHLNILKGTYTKPELAPVEAEWTGYRPDVSKDAPEPSMSEAQKYEALMKNVTSDATVLYFHGGAMYMMDPCTHRGLTSGLARISGGRVFSVRYRLAPHHPFPAALLDAFVSYLYLLYPPPESLHTAVPPSKIVFAGDSAGGNLCMALTQLLLQLRRTAETITFHGKEVEISLPAGVATCSAWLDLTRSLPSLETNAKFDYLPPPSNARSLVIPPCDIWPTCPPREEIYCNGNMLCHPLVSPIAADWSGAPPLCFVLGQEMLQNENEVVAARAANQGVKVVWKHFEAMPHDFPMMLPGAPSSLMAYQRWGGFIKTAVEKPEEVKTAGWWIEAKKLERKEVDVRELGTGDDALAAGAVTASMAKSMRASIDRQAMVVRSQAVPA